MSRVRTATRALVIGAPKSLTSLSTVGAPAPKSYFREELYQRGDTLPAFLERLGIEAQHAVRLAKLRTLIERVIGEFPESAEAIEYGFDCFAAVYPLPIWNAAAFATLPGIGVSKLARNPSAPGRSAATRM